MGGFRCGYRSANVFLFWQSRGGHRQSGSAAVQIDSRQRASAAVSDSGFWRKPGSAVDQQGGAGKPAASCRIGRTGCASFIRPAKRSWTRFARPMPPPDSMPTFARSSMIFTRQYAAADLIVSRAGATTVAEIKAAGRAAILVPFPFAADDHQTRNAQSMVEERRSDHDRECGTDGRDSWRRRFGRCCRISSSRRSNATREGMRLRDARAERIVDLLRSAVSRGQDDCSGALAGTEVEARGVARRSGHPLERRSRQCFMRSEPCLSASNTFTLSVSAASA